MLEMPRLAHWLRTWADRIDERAYAEADSNRPDALKADVMRFLDAVDSGGDLPVGWTLGGTAGGDDDRG